MRKLVTAVVGLSVLGSGCDFSANEEKLNEHRIREASRGHAKEDGAAAEDKDETETNPGDDVAPW